MKKIIIIFCFIICSLISYGATMKAATIYSDYNNYECKSHCVNILESAGYKVDSYENVNFDKLINNINNYDIVVGSTLYNYTNTIDISKFGKEINDYISNGGIFIIVEGVYETGVSWVNKVFPNLKYNYGKSQPKVHEYDKAVLLDKHNPICYNPTDVFVSWGTIKDYEGFNVLWTDQQGIPLVVYTEIGKGILIISSSGPFFQFPNISIINGLGNYVKGDKRLNDSYKEEIINLEKKSQKTYNLKSIQGVDDSKTDFSLNYNDKGIYFNFVCYDKDIINCSSNCVNRDDCVWNDDSVEIYFEKDSKTLYHFGVSYNNVQFDELNNELSFNTYFESKIQTGNDKWICDVFIPWSSLGYNNKSEKVKNIKFNVGRNYHPGRSNYGLYSLSDNLILDKNMATGVFSSPISFNKIAYIAPFDIVCDKVKYGNNKISLVSREGDTHTNSNAKSLSNFRIIDLSRGKSFIGKEGFANVDLDEGEHNLIAVVTDPTGMYDLASSKIKSLNVESIMNIDVIYPYYRDIVQSKDPNKNLRINCSVPEGFYDLVWTLKNEQIIKIIEFPINKDEVKKIKYDLSDLKPGKYTYTIELKDNNKIVSTVEKSFEVLEPASYEVTFDEKRICYVNGEAFFPNLMYHTTVGILNAVKRPEAPELKLNEVIYDVKAHNFNYAHALFNDVNFDHFKDYADAGLPLVSERNYEFGKPIDTNYYENLKANYNKYNMGLFYYSVDEPIGEKLKDAINQYDYLRKLDPHRPVTAAICYPSVFMDAKDAFDIVLPDIYPIRTTNKTPSFNSVLPTMELAKAMSGGKKPIWIVPQSFGGHNPKQQFWEPTKEEVKFQPWFYLTQGVTGIFWYAYQSGDTNDDTMLYNMFNITQTKLWEVFPELNKDIDAFSKIIIKGDNIGPLKSNNDKIKTCVWLCDGVKYAIITNPERDNQKVTFEELKGNIEPFFEKDKYIIKNGLIELKPLEYLIIKF